GGGAGSWPRRAGGVAILGGGGRRPHRRRRRPLLDDRGRSAQGRAARAAALGLAEGRGRPPCPPRAASPRNGAKAVPAVAPAHATFGVFRAARPSTESISPMTIPEVVAPASSCAVCGGEGFVFSVSGGRAAAVACGCTASCPECHGVGRVYAKDDRDFEIMRGFTCGA